MAGIENTAFTWPSVTGAPSGCFTVTRMLLSPEFGGSGALRKVTVISPALPVCTEDDDEALCVPPHDEASTAQRTTTAGTALRTNHAGRRRRISSPIANRQGIRNST